VERTSYAGGFALAGVLAFLGLATFLMTERLRIVPHRVPGVSS
jgi:hypothetical protein